MRGILADVRYAVTLALVMLMLASVASAATAPTLRLTSVDPITVSGSHFRAKERVRLVVTIASETWRRSAIATRTGTFQVAVGDLQLGRCAGLGIRATGSKGSAAMLKRLPLPACMP
jgi:hypothetical protein